MSNAVRTIDICICTFQRPKLLERLLEGIFALETKGLFTYQVLIGDNDSLETARPVVEKLQDRWGGQLQYYVEPTQNIARVRNRVLARCTSEFVALIDDDEFPTQSWLRLLLSALDQTNADGVLGPVLPHYLEETPAWFRKAGFYDFRKRRPTGEQLDWSECRTGNALLKRQVLTSLPGPFNSDFGTGGEDQDFFRRAIEQGRTFVWCDEAVAYETVQPARWQRKGLIFRALLRGKDSFRHRQNRSRNLAKALLAVPIYIIALPISLLAGQHRFMLLLTKLASHVGLLLAAVRMNPVAQRHS